MANHNMASSVSQQLFNNNNNQVIYPTPPNSQPSSSKWDPATQNSEVPHISNQDYNSSSKSSSEDQYEQGPSDDDIIAQATQFTRHIPPPPYTLSGLSKPVVIPQTIAGTGQTFARCWAPALTSCNITESDFVEFIDNLNVVATANPPLQVLDLVGGILGMVPHHIFQLAGAGVQAVAQLGVTVVSKGRTDMYMKAVNKDFFDPRGLKATITSRDAMALSLRLPGGLDRLPPITDENINFSIVERRLEGITPYISELRFDVPPPAQQTTILAKMGAGQVKRRTARTEKKFLKQRQKQVGRTEEESSKRYKEESKEQREYEKEMAKLDKKVRKATRKEEKVLRKGGRSADKAEEKVRKKMAKIGDKRREVENDFMTGTANGIDSESKTAERDKESKHARKALWILIENL